MKETKIKSKSGKEIIKYLMLTVLLVFIIVFFTIPSFIFADEGDVTTFINVRENDGNVGQYIMGDNNDTIKDTEGDGDTEVFCIDHNHYVKPGENTFGFTEDTVSKELIKDGDTEVDAYALEILSKEATGATSIEDQAAVWQLTNNTYGLTPDTNYGEETKKDKEDIDAIVYSSRTLAEDYLKSGGAKEQGKTIDEFLSDKKINKIDVTISQDDSIFENGGSGIATALMSNPLIPGVTDDNKDVYWYILAGSFNISFSPTSLVLDAVSKMNDVGSKGNDLKNPEDQNYFASKTDNYGKATVNYYYFWWGLADYPKNTMGVNLFTWVDIDDDGLLDIQDLPNDESLNPGETGYKDGNIVGNLQQNYKVVQSETGIDGKKFVKTDASGNIVTEPISKEKLDIHKVKGGLVVKKIKDGGFDDTRQSFSTISYNEPFNGDPKFFGTLIFKYYGDSTPLSDAQFGVFDNPSATGTPIMILVTDANGYASTGNSGLGYGTYYIKEISAPFGFDANPTIYTLKVGGNGVGILGTVDGDNIGITDPVPFSVINTPTPPTPPSPPVTTFTTTVTPTIAVAGLATGGGGIIEVAGLAFTGVEPIYPIAGLGVVLLGLCLMVASLINKKRVDNTDNKLR